MIGSKTTIYWLLIMLQSLFRDVYIRVFSPALLPETNVFVYSNELPTFDKVIASAGEPN